VKSKFQQVVKHTIVYGLGNAGQQLIGFFLLPVYTSYLAPDDYGRLAIISTLSALLRIILDAGISYSIFKFYFKAENLEDKKSIVSSALFWLSGIGLLFIAVFWYFSIPIAKLLMGAAGNAVYLQVMAITLVFTILQIIPLSIFRAQQKSSKYAILTISSFLVGMGLNIYFVVSLQLGVYGILLAGMLASLIFLGIGLYSCRNYIKPAFSWPVVTSMLRFGIPILPSGLSNYILRQADRWFLQHYTTLNVVGVYSLGYKIGETLNLFLVQPFQLVWLPLAFEMESRPDARRFYEKMLTYVVLVSFWMALGLSLLGRELLILMTTPKYYEAYTVIPWVALSYAAYSCYFVVNIGILLKNKTSYAVWIVGASALSNIIFNFWLIPSLGSLGAAQATLLSYLILFGIGWWVNRRVFPLRYEWTRILKVISVFLVLLFGGHFLSGNIFMALALKSLLLLAYWPILNVLRFYSRDELSWAKTAAQKYIFRMSV